MSPPAAGDGRAGFLRWRVFSLLVMMSFLSYMLRQDIQVAGQFMMPVLGIDEIGMGWIYAAFPLGYAIGQLPGGLLGERFGPRRLLTALGLTWLLTSAATGVLPGLFSGAQIALAGMQVSAVVAILVLIRLAVGLVHAPIFPVVAGTIATWFPVGRWGLPTAISSAGLTLGAAATQPLVLSAVQAWGWQIAFFMFVPPGALLFACWWWYSRDDPAEHPAIGRAELDLIRRGREALHAPPPEERGVWLRLLGNRETLLLTGGYFSMNVVFYLFFTWFLHYLVTVRGFSILAEGTGYLAALPWLTGTVGAVLGGVVCDALCARLGPRLGCRIPGATGLAATALFLLAGLHVNDPYMAVVLMSLCFGCTQLTEASFWQAQTFVASTHAASATGIMNTGGNVAGIVVGPLIPWLALELGWGWGAALSVGVAAALLGALMWMFVRADVPLPSRQAQSA